MEHEWFSPELSAWVEMCVLCAATGRWEQIADKNVAWETKTEWWDSERSRKAFKKAFTSMEWDKTFAKEGGEKYVAAEDALVKWESL